MGEQLTWGTLLHFPHSSHSIQVSLVASGLSCSELSLLSLSPELKLRHDFDPFFDFASLLLRFFPAKLFESFGDMFKEGNASRICLMSAAQTCRGRETLCLANLEWNHGLYGPLFDDCSFESTCPWETHSGFSFRPLSFDSLSSRRRSGMGIGSLS